jgi:hypothetical protein
VRQLQAALHDVLAAGLRVQINALLERWHRDGELPHGVLVS